jgi:hypothetical protein
MTTQLNIYGEEEEPRVVRDLPNRVVVTDDYYGYAIPVPRSFTFDLMASESDKWTALESIGIDRRDDATPLQAWRDAIADESGLDRATLDPRQGGVCDLGFTDIHTRKFLWFLA